MPAYQGTSHEVRFVKADSLFYMLIHLIIKRKYDTKTTSRAGKQQVLSANLLPSAPSSQRIRRYSAHNLPNKASLQLSEVEQRTQLASVGLVHQPQPRGQQHRRQQGVSELAYLVNRNSSSSSSSSSSNLSSQLLVDLVTQTSNRSSRVEAYLEVRLVIMRLNQVGSQHLVVRKVILPRVIIH
jgi:hypothetical protein